ncbi:toxin-antitoxin system HicB family antitoxin [Actinoallomurus purpureus]|uniref:toxin-antitoxin system HicB family antitoxin n=1 Tax=Actinoallomurus purpureus TaxID=478114 RepID=UPI0020925638|nr:toxin-antitoxin system HicB family antitoxin [Actinoallomurus purpureus]MCO6004632.1 toxin-antitoxin system HicB family antitoxin [Actinoallomurus purpureus]
MHLESYVAQLRQELAVAAEAGGEETRELAERLTAPLQSAVRLVLLEALSTAAEEITRELAPGSVDLRLRRGEPEFVVESPATGAEEAAVAAAPAAEPAPPVSYGAKDGAVSRISLRLPEELKTRAEQAADREGLSVNAWLVRTIAEAVERTDREHDVRRRSAPRGGRYTGWAR